MSDETENGEFSHWAGWDRGVMVLNDGRGNFSERPMTEVELAARHVGVNVQDNIYELANYAGGAAHRVFEQVVQHVGPAFDKIQSQLERAEIRYISAVQGRREFRDGMQKERARADKAEAALAEAHQTLEGQAAELAICRKRFNRVVRVEQEMFDIFHGKKPMPDKQWFWDTAITLGTPEEYQSQPVEPDQSDHLSTTDLLESEIESLHRKVDDLNELLDHAYKMRGEDKLISDLYQLATSAGATDFGVRLLVVSRSS